MDGSPSKGGAIDLEQAATTTPRAPPVRIARLRKPRFAKRKTQPAPAVSLARDAAPETWMARGMHYGPPLLASGVLHVLDLIFVATTLACFGAAVAYTLACDRV
jgi:hypothetical protein